MKKKKLKKQIAELESRLGAEKSRAQAWNDIAYRFIDELRERGVRVQIIPAEPPVIDASHTEDDVSKYEYGINTASPTLLFDFTEHDKTVIRTYFRGINHGKE